MKSVLYLPSTPLNILLSIAHAAAFQSSQKAHLVLIDQKQIEDNLYFQVLKSSGLFSEVAILPGNAKGKGKLVERKQSFANLQKWSSLWKPELIMVGSDRRVEFQYLMNHLQGIGCQGGYLDDGLYSYAGKPAVWYKDTVNALLKKLSYGFWWDEPATVGASKWIDQAWLFQPDEVVEELKAKELHYLNLEFFQNTKFKKISEMICGQGGLNHETLERLKDIELIVLIPHPNNIQKMEGYKDKLMVFLDSVTLEGLKVAVKYHPREQQDDSLGLNSCYGALILPKTLAFEFILPFAKKQSLIVGDVGTALLTAQWLRPDLSVFAVLSEGDKFQSSFVDLYARLGVQRVSDFTKLTAIIESGELKK